MVLVVVVVRRFGPPVLAWARRAGRIELDVKRVLVDVLRRAVKQGDAVVAGVGADVAAEPAHVARQRGQQEDVAVLIVVVEELVGAHADGEQRGAGLLGEVPRQRLHRRRRRPGQLLHRLGVEVRRILLDQVEHRAAAELLAIGQRHLDGAFEQRIRHVRVPPDHVAREQLRRVRGAVPPHVIAPLHPHLLRYDLVALRRRRRLGFALFQHSRLVLQLRRLGPEHILRAQVFQGVHPHQHRQVGPLLDVAGVVELLAQDHVGEAQRQRRRGAGPHDDHVIALARGRRVFAGDHHHARPLEPGFGEPVRIRHLGGDPVHSPDHQRFAVLDRREIELHRLLAGHHGVARRQVGVPGIVVEAAPADGLIGPDLADLRVQQRHRVRHPVKAEDPRHAQQRHAAAEFQHLRPGAAGGLDGDLVIMLRPQPLLSFFAAVSLGNVLQGRGHDPGRLVMRHANPLVAAAIEVLPRREAVFLAREAFFVPAFETRPHHALVDPPVAVEPPCQRQPLLAHARVPAIAGAVAGQVGGLPVAHSRADAGDNPLAHVGVQQAVVRVVGSAEEGEPGVVLPEIAIDPFPSAVRVGGQRIGGGFQSPGVPRRGYESAESGGGGHAQELASRHFFLHGFFPSHERT